MRGGDGLVLTGDLINDPAAGATLSLRGNITVEANTGVEKLINLGALDLTNDTLAAGLTLQNSGVLTLTSTVGAGTLINQGAVNATSGNILGSLIQPASGTFRLDGTPGGVAVTVAGTVDNSGLIELNGQANTATFTAPNGILNRPGGTVGGNGTFSVGTGTAGLTNQGILRPGMSPGTLSVTGDLILDGVNGSITQIELGGLAAGTQYDVINVSGQVRGGLRTSQIGER